jgi:hypothetical protein
MDNIKNELSNLEVGKKTILKHQGIKLSVLKGSNNLFVKAKQPILIKIGFIVLFFFIVQIVA